MLQDTELQRSLIRQFVLMCFMYGSEHVQHIGKSDSMVTVKIHAHQQSHYGVHSLQNQSNMDDI